MAGWGGDVSLDSGGHVASEGDLKELALFKSNGKTSEGINLGLVYRHPAAFIQAMLCTAILPDLENKQFKKQIRSSVFSTVHIH